MIDGQVVELGSLVDAMIRSGQRPGTEGLAQLAQTLGKLFGVASDEVAILTLNPKNKTLTFVIPEKLAEVGTIPLTSASALAARTARERKAELINNFSTSRHATVFEGVPLGRRQGEHIHKIMSAPILDGVNVVGVIQISRKGQSAANSGPDFVQKDLRVLTSLSPALERFLKLCPAGSSRET
jgi:hypothetical protein